MKPVGPTGSPSRTPPRTTPKKTERLTAFLESGTFGTVIPIIHGEGTVDGVLAWANAAVVEMYATTVTIGDDGEPTAVRPMAFGGFVIGNKASASPAVYLFAQGVIAEWLWVSRDDVKFGPRRPVEFRDLTAWIGTAAVPPELTLGDPATATEWPYAVGASLGPASRAPLGHLALLRTAGMVMPDGKFPTDLKARLVGSIHTFISVVSWSGYETGTYAADPSLMLKDIVENGVTGFGMSGLVETDYGPDRQTESSFDAYMAARDWHLARVWADASAATDAIQEICDSCDAEVLWTGEAIRIIPLGETPITRTFAGVTYTYTPPTTAHGFTDDDFVLEDPNSDPIEARRTPDTDIPTVVPVEYTPYDSADGTKTLAESVDASKASALGVVRSEPLSLPCIAFGAHARAISQIRAQRGIHNRTQFRWVSSWRHIAVQPGDLATLTHAMMGLNAQLVRVTSVEETDDGLAFEAIEWHSGVSVTAETMPQTSDGISKNPMVPPDSNTIRSELEDMASDGVFSVAEHGSARMAWDDLAGSNADLVSKADAAVVDHAAWSAALTALGTYLNGGTTWTTGVPSWLTGTVSVPVTAATWQSTWAAAYTARVELQNALTAAAQYDANVARGQLDAIASDAVFSAGEHALALMAWNDLLGSKTGLVAKATSVGVSSSAFTDALTTLGTYLNGGTAWTTGTPSWLTAPFSDVAITAATWRTNWDTAYLRRNQLILSFTPVMSASIVPASLSTTRTGSGTATVTSGNTLVVPSNGQGPFSYAWAKVSGTTLTVTGQNSATFSASLAANTSASAVYRCTVTDANGATCTVDVSVSLTNYTAAAPLSATASPTTVSGNGNGMGSQDVESGYTTITPSGGTAPYTYSWAKVSGDTLTVSGTNYAMFTEFVDVDAEWAAVYRCTVTDNVSATTTVDVTISLSNWSI